MGQYEKYIVKTPRPDSMTRYRLPPDIRKSLIWMDSSVVNDACNMECVWYYKPFDGPPHHVHEDTDEILGFFGSDPDNPSSLGGEIQFRFEDEWVTLTESCVIFLPRGLPHCPFRVVRVDKPIFHVVVSPQLKFAHSHQDENVN